MNSSSCGPRVREHQAGVEHAAVRRALGGHAGDRRPDDLGHRALGQLRRHAWRRRIRAHAAGVRAAVALADALVVLRGAELQHARAIDQGEQARFFAEQAVLEQDGRAGLAERAAERGIERRQRLVDAARDGHALAGGEPVRLDHHRRAVRAHVGPGRVGLRSREGPERRGRNAVAGAEFLGERLGAFEAGGGGARAECRDTSRLQPVDEAEHQRQLRPWHHQVDAFFPAEGDDAGESSGASGTQVASRAIASLPGAQYNRSTSGEAASAQHSACSRPPAPTTRTFMPTLLTNLGHLLGA